MTVFFTLFFFIYMLIPSYQAASKASSLAFVKTTIFVLLAPVYSQLLYLGVLPKKAHVSLNTMTFHKLLRDSCEKECEKDNSQLISKKPKFESYAMIGREILTHHLWGNLPKFAHR